MISGFDAFNAGCFSFVSACVLPLAPGFIAYVAACVLAVPTLPSDRASISRLPGVIGTFVLGFSTVFIVLATPGTWVGDLFSRHIVKLSRGAGLIVVALGLWTLAAGRYPGVWPRSRSAQLAVAAIVGMSFAFGWSPCIGPVLAIILALAGSAATAGDGLRLLIIYSAGLAVPFVLVGLASGKLAASSARPGARGRPLRLATSSVVLAGTGALIATDRLTLLAQFLSKYLPEY